MGVKGFAWREMLNTLSAKRRNRRKRDGRENFLRRLFGHTTSKRKSFIHKNEDFFLPSCLPVYVFSAKRKEWKLLKTKALWCMHINIMQIFHWFQKKILWRSLTKARREFQFLKFVLNRSSGNHEKSWILIHLMSGICTNYFTTCKLNPIVRSYLNTLIIIINYADHPSRARLQTRGW